MVNERPTLAPIREGFSVSRQSPQSLDISEADERGLMFEKMFEEANVLGNFAADLYGNFHSFATQEKKISAEEATKLYGQNGLLIFNEPITPSLAQARAARAAKAEERNQILSTETLDNDTLQNIALFGSAASAILLDPVNYINVTGGLAAFLKAGRVANLLSKSGFSDDVLRIADDVLTGRVKGLGIGGNTALGFARGAVDVGLPNLVSEIGLYETAMNNGYDYEVMSAVGFGLGATGLGGALGALSANMAYKSFYKSFKVASDINSVSEKLFADTFTFLDVAPRMDLVNRETLELLITKHTSDLMEGKMPSVNVTRAILAYSGDQKLVAEFVDNLRAGKYAGIIDDDTAKALRASDIPALKRQGLDFRAWVAGALEEGIGNKLFRPIIDSGIIQRYAGRLTNAKQIREVLSQLQTEISDLSSQVNQLNIKASTAGKKYRAGHLAKKQELEKQLGSKIQDHNTISSYGSKFHDDKMMGFLSRIETKDYTEVSSDTFRANYKKLVKRIKDRKTKSPSQWNNLSEKAREDLYQLFEMVEPNLSREPLLDDLLGFTDEELIALHQHKVLSKELGSLSREQAFDILKQELLDPEIKLRQKVNKSLDKIRNEAISETDISKLSGEQIQKDLDSILENSVLKDDVELNRAFKMIDDELQEITERMKLETEAYNCLLGI
jgi:hypothetical protein